MAAAKELGATAHFVGIDSRDPGTAQAKAFQTRYGITWPSFYSPGGEALLAFPRRAHPQLGARRPSCSTRRAGPAAAINGCRARPPAPWSQMVRQVAHGVADWFQQQASSGSLVLAIPVALVAGLVSFFSPCVIPLLPGYLSYATGLSGADLEHAPARPDAGRLAALRARLLGRLRAPRLGVRLGRGLARRLAAASSRSCSGVLTILLGLAFVGLVPLLAA